ncbi:MAG: anti-sigma regulatory factor [Candidatus Kryptoniota bacterium]
MENETHIRIGSDVDIVVARERGRAIGKAAGFSSTDLTIIATAISEVARNILIFAKTGEIILGTSDQGERRCITIIAEDKGPGIRDISLAMQDGYSTAKGLGLGLPGTRRLMDEFQVISSLGKGTTVTMKKWIKRNG